MEVFRRLLTTIENVVGSRKIVLAICTFIAAIAARYGLNVDPVALAIAVGPIIAAILGIAWEDAATNKSAGNATVNVTNLPPPPSKN